MQSTDDQTELFTWVDENDLILGTITREDAHNGSFKIHRGIWVLVFNDQEELYLQKRSLTKDNNPGLWSLSVGGHVTYGEIYAEAVKREFAEELGVIYPSYAGLQPEGLSKQLRGSYTRTNPGLKGIPPVLELLHKYHFIGKRETEISCVYRTHHSGPFKLNPKEIDQGDFFSLSLIEAKVVGGELKLANWALAIIQVECKILLELSEPKECIIKVFPS